MEVIYTFWQKIFHLLTNVALMPFEYLTNTDKRVHVLYLCTSLLLAGYVFWHTKQKGNFWHYVFHPKVWLGKSARIDYALFLFNGLVKVVLVLPFVQFGFFITFWISNQLTQNFGYLTTPISPWLIVTAYTLLSVVVNDFFVFLIHYAMHKNHFLWEFHKVHHAAQTMNPFTQYRVHPIELIINNVVFMIVFGLMTGIFDYLSGGSINKWVFLGTNVFSFLFFAWGANLRHSHVALRYFPWLEHILISPVQHQIHHSRSRKHWNKNMGSHLAIWDWLFGTLYTSEKKEHIIFGISKKEDLKYQTFKQNLLFPFIRCYHRLRKCSKTSSVKSVKEPINSAL